MKIHEYQAKKIGVFCDYDRRDEIRRIHNKEEKVLKN